MENWRLVLIIVKHGWVSWCKETELCLLYNIYIQSIVRNCSHWGILIIYLFVFDCKSQHVEEIIFFLFYFSTNLCFETAAAPDGSFWVINQYVSCYTFLLWYQTRVLWVEKPIIWLSHSVQSNTLIHLSVLNPGVNSKIWKIFQLVWP